MARSCTSEASVESKEDIESEDVCASLSGLSFSDDMLRVEAYTIGIGERLKLLYRVRSRTAYALLILNAVS